MLPAVVRGRQSRAHVGCQAPAGAHPQGGPGEQIAPQDRRGRQELEIPSAGGMPGMEAANIYGSLTMAGKHLLLTNDIGDTLVLAPGRAFQEESHNYLDEGSGATPVADGSLLLLRGTKKLYCIGDK